MNDSISRQAAIDILDAYQVMVENGEENPYSWARLRMSELPSAQPERLTDYSFEESCTDCPAYDTENHRCPRFNQVIRMALKDANLEPCEDCISRQAAINAIENTECELLPEEWDDLTDAIMSVPSAQTERRWIPCSERLPEYDGEKYLVTVYCESINRARIHLSTCYINREGFWGDVPLGYTVVAWMPLPRAYEGGQRE